MDVYKISSLKGVVSFVKFGKEFATLSQSNIDNIILTINKFSQIEVTASRFQPGERILIKQGPLIGFECELITHQGKKKALVRLDMLNRNILVNIDLESIVEKRHYKNKFFYDNLDDMNPLV
jgi:transcription antitermination factor NusG